ncbi:hypothetical protein [Anatilimnocola floriformis]|uniref:hypothetical protein n=1 Tax=Anatilimnocola floriformis TaxID=2948575 RepID=UPI0020C37592|nr:hypothetical protein [Anatilimnocola floriformis]
MARALTLAFLASIVLVCTISTAHAQPRIAALVPRAGGDNALNSHGWALERDPDRIVLMSPSKISLHARAKGGLLETGESVVANEHELSYFTIANLGNARFFLPDTNGTSFAVFEAKREPNPHLERLKDLTFSRKFRQTNGLSNGASVILTLPSGPLAVFRRVHEVSSVQWNAEARTIESGGKAWDGDQKWHTSPLPSLSALCTLGDGEALVAAQRLDSSETGRLTIFQAFPDRLEPLTVTTEKQHNEKVRQGLLLLMSLASSRDGKLVVGCGGEQATLFECNEKKELTHRGLYCSAIDKDNHGWATGIEGLVRPRLCAVGDTCERIAFVDELGGGVSLCRYDLTTRKLVLVQAVDLSKLLSDKAGTPIAVTFAGEYLRISTTRYQLIELDFEKR